MENSILKGASVAGKATKISKLGKTGKAAVVTKVNKVRFLKRSGVFRKPELESSYQKYTVKKVGKGQTPRDRLNWKTASEESHKRFGRGNAFNQTARTNGPYLHHEVHLVNGKRLDTYDRKRGEIISRKATDLDQIQETTFRRYLSELDRKYARGTKIRSNKHRDIDGELLRGDYILEIPDTNRNLPDIDRYIQIADEYGVSLRFTKE